MNTKAKLSLTVIALLAVSLAPAAMIDVPQTRAEFVKAVTEGKGATAFEKLQVEQPLAKIYAVLEERAKTCLDVVVTRTANVGYVERSSSDYNPTVQRVAEDRAEFTLQVVNNPRGVGHVPPAGGLYVMAADFRATDAGHVEIVLYRPTIGFKKIVESLKQWSAGDPASCPKLR